MYSFHVSIIGVIIAAASTMVLGWLWYSPFLFGKKWMQLVGMTSENMAEAKSRASFGYIGMTVNSLVMAYVVAVFLKNLFIPSPRQALIFAIFAWLGFVATTGSSEYFFNAKPKPWLLYCINVGFNLVAVVIQALILFWFTP